MILNKPMRPQIQKKKQKLYQNLDEETIEKYLEEIVKIKLLSYKEEIILARKIRRGYNENATQYEKKIAKKCIDLLIKSNLRFVVSIAKKYQNQGLSFSDLINEGNMGLIKGICRFDERKGYKCISYCVWWIRQSILQAISEQSRGIRCPTNKIAFYNKVNKFILKFEQKFQIKPTIKEISDTLKCTEKEVDEALLNSYKLPSLDAPLNEEEEPVNWYEILTNKNCENAEEKLELDSLKEEIQSVLKTLPEREAKIIKLHFGLGCYPHSLEEIAKILKLTRERCRQIEIHTLKRLRHTSKFRKLISFLY
ncbi:RNA polymerase sigma factor rpoD [Candidatus Karelsulcia muelleri]|uniref:sigma-70 family RNA polymerase sigma factor n=1 Tax=Candidatus Karelsulcia muelleri TaxID=336810 RepID=UPI001FF55B74|nr:RNA polymerase sigma factor RpoD/SigA [Candidatus Karelsulcia muelleri]UOQ27769.1 RNA polymerase sigma factor rpoD [Candidatus Karelsulcia muelleri]